MLDCSEFTFKGISWTRIVHFKGNKKWNREWNILVIFKKVRRNV